MDKEKAIQKMKDLYLYLPIWLVIVVVTVSIALGIFIGNGIHKPNKVENQEKTTAAAESTTKPEEVDKTKWNLILVNKWNKLPADYEAKVTYLNNGHAVDERAYPDLMNMLDDCKSEGLEPLICSSYRTMEKQQELFSNKINEYISYGYSKEQAEQKAGELVAIPGTSEHQLGLAVDIVDISYQILDEKQENTDVQKWLMKNSYKYGFILRYPTDKSSITGISYEPWHYRYVGKEAAKEIFDAQICLEEYLEN